MSIKKKFAIFTSSAMIGIFAGIMSTSSAAHLAYSYDIEYYSDATKSYPVGLKSISCSGRAHMSGEVTPYSIINNQASCGGGYECPASTPYCF